MQLLNAIRHNARPGLWFAVLCFGLFSGATSTGMLLLINEYIFGSSPLNHEETQMAYVGLLFLVVFSRYLSSITLAKLGLQTAYDLRIRLGERILGAPLRQLEKVGTHRLMVSLTDDINAVTDAMSTIPMFVINVSLVLGCIVYLGWLSLSVLMVILVFLLVAVVSYMLPLQAGVRRQEMAREMEDDLFDSYRGMTQGTKELKMRRGRRKAFLGELDRSAEDFRDMSLSAERVFLLTASWGNLLFFASMGIVIFVVPTFMDGVDIRIMASYVMVLIYMVTPLQMVLSQLPMITEADVAVRKIERLGISLSKGADAESGLGEVDLGWKKLEFRDISHVYHQEDDLEFTLGPLNLAFKPGELVFLVGGNGSGKTTFAKIALGLYQPEEGGVYLDGEVVSGDQLLSYREMYSAVFTDFHLFESLLGLDSAELDEDAKEYIEVLQLSHKVRVKDGKFSTLDLSQGQRKRLALLTAYLEDSPIFLFDEWAADQDPEFKKVFYQQLLPALKARGKLVLVISHDDRYYHGGDRIIKFEFGKVVADTSVSASEFATTSS
jgi:putative ATP-binding cassette transporter